MARITLKREKTFHTFYKCAENIRRRKNSIRYFFYGETKGIEVVLEEVFRYSMASEKRL